MKKVLCSILLAAILSILTISAIGCHGAGETSKERTDDHLRQLRVNGSLMVDDIDAVLQQNRPSRLSEYTVR
ncbi:MAG: hypothetical protein JW806_09150 [Sedimentisphaerales bacterium]|nr:hypothetical protein [Sedimentisphaerales bacterium]